MKKLATSSIRVQLILLVLIALVPATAIIVVKNVQQRNAASLDAETTATTLVQTLSLQQDRASIQARRLLVTIAQLRDVQLRQLPQCDTLFSSLISRDEQYVSLLLIDPDGSVIASSSPFTSATLTDRRAFRQAILSKKFSAGAFARDPLTNTPVLYFAYPILDAQQHVRMILAVGLSLENFSIAFSHARLPERSELVVADWRGIILHAEPDTGRIGTPEESDLLTAMQHGNLSSGSFHSTQNGVEFDHAFHHSVLDDTGEQYLSIRVSINMDVALAGIRRSMLANFIAIFCVYVFALGMAWIFADRSIILKIRLAVDAAKKIAGGSLEAGTSIPHSGGELGTLFSSFDEMSAALRRRDEEDRVVRTMLQEVGERYRMLFEHIPQPLLVVDSQSQHILTVNNAAVCAYGYTEEEFLHLSYTDLLADEQVRRMLTTVPHAALPDEPSTGIKKHIRKNGEPVDVELYCSSITYRGIPAHMVSVTDITERIRAEKIQHALYKIYRASNMAGNLQELYAMIHRILGEIVPAQNFSIALHDAERDTISYPYFVDEYEVTPLPQRSGRGLEAHVLRTGEPLLVTKESVRALAADGCIETATFAGREWLGAPLKVDDRSIGLVALRSYDDTVRFKEKDKIFLLFISSQIAKAIDRKRADDALRESERRLRRSQASLSEAQALATLGSWHKDFHTGITTWSDTLFAIFGLPANRPVPHSDEFYSIVHPDDAAMVRAMMDRTIAGATTHLDYRIVIHGSTVRYVTSKTKPVFDQHHALVEVIGTILDITDRKEAEEQICQSLREKDVLLKEIHHRVKNNMQIISSLLNLQAEGRIDPAAREVLQESRQRVRSMALIHEHLYQSDKISEIDLNEYIQNIVVHLFHSYDREDVRSRIDIAPIRMNLDAAVPCGLIVNELVSNALKYAFPSGAGGTVSVSIAVADEHTVHLDVADDGIGIPPTLELESLETLGLQLVKSLVDQLQGTMEIAVADGTRVHIQFHQ